MEYRDLYDGNKKPTGEKIKKGDPIPPNKFYITVMVFCENSKGQVLLQKRPLWKGGHWATTGGHPKSGESSLQGMVTEIREEIGLEVAEEELKLFKTEKTEDDFVDLYYLKKDIDISQLTKQIVEVEEIKWFSKQEIDDMIKNGAFFKYHINEYNEFLKFLKGCDAK